MDVSELQTILSLDWKYGLVFVAAVIIIAVWIIQKFDFLVSKFGFTTERMRKDEQKEKDIAELKKHSDRTDEKIDKIFDSMDEMKTDIKELSTEMRAMQKKQDDARRNQLRDRIGQSYRYYAAKKEWNHVEKEAFDGLIESYEAAGGNNGFVHSKCIPESMTWTITDE